MKKNVKKRQLSTLLRGSLLLLFLWAFYQNSYAQYDNEHYIPPLVTINGAASAHNFQRITISTLETTAFDVEITLGDGTILPTSNAQVNILQGTYGSSNGIASVSSTNPLVLEIGNRQSNTVSGFGCVNINAIDTGDGNLDANSGGLSTKLKDQGLIVKSTNGERFFVNMRHEAGNQGASLTSKGKIGLGQEFRAGVMPTKDVSNPAGFVFISVMATKNNTDITFSDFDTTNGVEFIGHSGTPSQITVTLDAGESYAIAQKHNRSVVNGLNKPEMSEKFNGIKVTANKDIVVASGGGGGTADSSGSNPFDYGYDQLVPTSEAGDYYVLVKGLGAEATEYAIVVPTQDNTTITVKRGNGNTRQTFNNLNAGEYGIIDGSINNIWDQDNMFITSDKPIFVYQITNGDNDSATGSMNLIPPANLCSTVADITIADPRMFANNNSDNANLNITLAEGGTVNIYKNGVLDTTLSPSASGAEDTSSSNVGDGIWYTYTYDIAHVSGGVNTVRVEGVDTPVNVGFLGTDNSVKGGAGYFAGFASPITATIDPATITIAGGGAGAQYINEGTASPDNEFTLEFEIELSSSCSSPISLDWEIVAGTATIGGGSADVSVSGGATSGTINFAGGAGASTVQTVTLPTITVNDDSDIEGLENIIIRLSNPVNVSIAVPDTEIIIIDDETPAQAQCPGATVGDLEDGGLTDPRWYDTPTNGTELSTTDALTNLTLYYVSDGPSTNGRTAHLVRLAATGELFFADIIKSPTDPSFSLMATSPFTDDISYSIIDPISGMEVTSLNGVSLGGANNAMVTLGGAETSVLLRATQAVTDGGGGTCTPITAEALLIISADTDGDGVVNFYDIDDDNDGIVDFNELNCSVPPPVGITFNTSGTISYDNPITRAFTNFNGFLDSDNATGIKVNTNHELIAFEYNGTIYSTGVNNSRFQDDNNDFLPDGLDVGLVADGTDILPVIATRWRAIEPVNEFTAGEAVEPSALDGDPTENNASAIGPAIINAAAAPRNVLLTYGERGLSLSTGVFNPGGAGVLTYSLSSIDPNTIGDGVPDLLVNHLGLTGGSNRQIDISSYDASGNIIGNTARVVVGSDPLLDQNLDRYDSGGSDNIDRPLRLEVIELSELGLTAANSANVQFIQVNLGTQSDIAFVAYNEQSINVCSDRHTDTDGIPDHLDLDSDNDGIPDNIEGQTTTGYVAPGVLGIAMQDSDGDGLSDTYDNNGTNTYPTEGIEPVDTDGLIEDPTGEQTVPDFRDRDSDNDFFTDTYETSSVSFTALSYTNVNGGITDPSTFPDTNSSTSEVDYREEADTDQDTVLDKNDIDSDNDGILDTEDCLVGDDITGITGASTGVVSTSKGHTVTIDGDNMTIGDGNFGTNPSPYDFKLAGSDSGINTNTITFTFSEPISSLKLIVYDYDTAEFMNNFSVAPIQVDGDANFDGSQIINPQNNLSYTITWAALPAGTTSISYDHTRSGGAAVFIQFEEICFDTDGDGIPNYLDLDSDNDGIYDIVEAGNGYAATYDTNNDGLIDDITTDNTANDADNDGLSDLIETNIAADTGLTPINTNSSTNADYANIDSDGDLCYDTNEAYNTDNANFEASPTDTNDDGTYGGALTTADINANGTVAAASYNPTAGNLANVIDNTENLCDVDTDGDGVFDKADLDDDNDGILDTDEQNCNLSVSGVTFQAHSSTVTAGSNATAIYTDFNGYHTGTSTRANDYHNLIAFTANGSTFTTGVENSRIIDSNSDGIFEGIDTNGNGSVNIPAVSSRWRALRPGNDIVDGSVSEAALADGDPVNVLGMSSLPGFTPSTVRNSLLTFGKRGLDISTGVFNPEAGGNLLYKVLQVNPNSVDDGVPDLIINHIGGPASSESTRRVFVLLYDAAGNVIGDRVKLLFPNNSTTTVGKQRLDIYNKDTGVGTRYDRDVRFKSMELSETGITSADAADVAFLRVQIDTDMDIAFAAYNEESFVVCEDLDSDGDNIPNHLDLDSDNDGVYDVIEAGGTDANNDGKADDDDDNADNTSSLGIPTSTAGGLAVQNTDGDAFSNHLDIDSDNDGCYDVNEAYNTDNANFNASPADTNNDGTYGGVITSAEVDVNGLVTGASYTPAVGNLAKVTSTAETPVCFLDTDNDGVYNDADLDDDNDGILDTEEGCVLPLFETEFTTGAGSGTVQGTLSNSDDSVVFDLTFVTSPNLSNGGLSNSSDVFAGGTQVAGLGTPAGFNNQLTITPQGSASLNDFQSTMLILDFIDEGTYVFSQPMTNLQILSGTSGVSLSGDGLTLTVPTGPQQNISLDFIGTLSSPFNVFVTSLSSGTYTFELKSKLNDCPDTDNDGVTNNLDLDSDNDGIYDVIEAGGTDANNDGKADDDDDNVDNLASNGIPTSAGVGIIPTETTSGTADFLNLDSDSDGCFDANEAYTTNYANFLTTATDTNGDGTYGGVITSADVDENGVITGLSHTTNVTSLANVIDPTQRICDTDSDSDGIFDKEDLDADNDAILDNIENITPYTDADNDGVPIFLDDDDTDATVRDTDGVEPAYDTDGDGIANHLDLDADGDGCADAIEGGGAYVNSHLVTSTMAGSEKGNLGTTVDTNNSNPTYGVPIVAPAVTAIAQAIGDSDDNTVATACAFDLQLTKTVDKSVVRVNDTIVYSLTVTNHGANEASGITVTDTLPTGISFDSASAPSGTTFTSGTGVWDFGSEVLANGESLTLTITVTVNGTGSIANQAEISTATGTDIDSTPGNGN